MSNPFVFEIETGGDYEAPEWDAASFESQQYDYESVESAAGDGGDREFTEEEVQYSIIISPTSPGDSRFRVPASDTTTPSSKKFPFNTICFIEIDRGKGFVAGGSGNLIAPQVVLTARHVLLDNAGKPEPKVRVTPGADLSASGSANRTPAKPGNLVADKSRLRWSAKYDYGVIILPKPFANPSKFYMLEPSRKLVAGNFLNVAGYPCDKAKGTMWAHYEPVLLTGVSATHLKYTMDTCPGHSGSPVWIKFPSGVRCQVAVHTSGVSPVTPETRCKNDPAKKKCIATPPGSPATPVSGTNAGVYITCDVIKDIFKWCDEFKVKRPSVAASFSRC